MEMAERRRRLISLVSGSAFVRLILLISLFRNVSANSEGQKLFLPFFLIQFLGMLFGWLENERKCFLLILIELLCAKADELSN